jgi:hypothetical protein
MSYHVEIVRTRGGHEVPISVAEAAEAAGHLGGLAVSFDGRGGLELGRQGAAPSLTWQGGRIWTGAPDPETLALMIELAAALGGRVRGDDLETYRAVDDTYLHEDDAPAIEEASRERIRALRLRRWRQYRVHAAIFGTFLLLSVLVALLSRR